MPRRRLPVGTTSARRRADSRRGTVTPVPDGWPAIATQATLDTTAPGVTSSGIVSATQDIATSRPPHRSSVGTMGRFLVRAVEWLAAYGAGVVVLSATLPPKRVDELLLAYQAGAGGHGATEERPSAGYPGWVAWSVEDGFAWQAVRPRQEWTLTVTRRDVPAGELTEQVASAAVSASVGGGCVLLVRSTVRAAQDTYEAIRRADSDLMPGQNIDILHSRFPAARSNAGTKGHRVLAVACGRAAVGEFSDLLDCRLAGDSTVAG